MFIPRLAAYNVISKRDGKDGVGKILRICVIFYRTWNGDRTVDRRQRDTDYCRGALPAVRLSLILPVTGMWEKDSCIPVFAFKPWVRRETRCAVPAHGFITKKEPPQNTGVNGTTLFLLCRILSRKYIRTSSYFRR